MQSLPRSGLLEQVVLSDFILRELKDKLIRKFEFAAAEVNAAVRLVKTRSEIVRPSLVVPSVCRDADDDNIIGTAMAGQCACIVTGDKDLLDLGEVGPIKIVAPSSFWKFETAFSG